MSTLKGIDVSYAQGNVNWGHVTADFAIIRAGYGREVSQKDNQFENNYAGCKSNRIPCGAYWYSYALDEADAVREAKACLEVIKGKTFEYPIYFDIEEKKQFELGKAKCSAIAKAFLDTVEKAGYWVGIYCSTFYLTNYISEELRKRYAVWVAQYNNTCTYKGDYGMWQYGTSRMNGINGEVDVDLGYIDYPTLIKNAGLNGFKKPSVKPNTPVVTAKALDTTGCKKGEKSLAVLNLKALLLEAKKRGLHKQGMDKNNAFGDGTLKAVNYLLGRWGYAQNGIAGSNFTLRLLAELEKV